METEELESRRSKAIEKLQQAVDLIGPITDKTPHRIREPILIVIDQIQTAGEELRELKFESP